MENGYISALFGLVGAMLGGLTSFASTWLTVRSQSKDRHHDAMRSRLESLFSDFIAEASRLFGDAL